MNNAEQQVDLGEWELYNESRESKYSTIYETTSKAKPATPTFWNQLSEKHANRG